MEARIELKRENKRRVSMPAEEFAFDSEWYNTLKYF